ncbi:MAG TPA: NfeD family protein [Clostridiales bacterium]|nr:NfeD family protein [Clostridiales bacterium]
MEQITYVWVGLIILFLIIEASTMGLTTIWFTIGAIFALIAAGFGWAIEVQITIFIIISLILLIFTRPIALKYLKVGHTKTNVNAIIGKTGIVIIPIPEKDRGQVKVGGQIWTAIGLDGESMDLHEEVEVVAVEGVKLIVKRI